MLVVPMKAATDLRATLEGFAARHAAQRIADGADHTELLDCYHAMQRVEDYRQFAAADQALHHCVVRLADVPGLENAWREVFKAQDAFRSQTIERYWPDFRVLIESHRGLVDAVVAGDVENSERAAVAHLDAIWFRLAEHDIEMGVPHSPLLQACSYLAFHFHEPIRLTELAARIPGCSSGHLARLFREELGLSFSDYLNELRMQKAAELLQQTRESIQSIAAQVGYGDPSRFSSHFRRQFQKTPREFRRYYAALAQS